MVACSNLLAERHEGRVGRERGILPTLKRSGRFWSRAGGLLLVCSVMTQCTYPTGADCPSLVKDQMLVFEETVFDAALNVDGELTEEACFELCESHEDFEGLVHRWISCAEVQILGNQTREIECEWRELQECID